MNITLNINQYIPRCIYFGDPVQNTIMENSRFVKLIYSNELVIMNGLYFEIPLNITHKATYFKRNKYFFDINKEISQETIRYAQDIEYTILRKYMDSRKTIFSKEYSNNHVPTKSMKLMVYDSFQHGCIKSESGSEFYTYEESAFHNDNNNHSQQYSNSNSNTNAQVNSNSTTSSNPSSFTHPNYHLKKQRSMRHSFRKDRREDKEKCIAVDSNTIDTIISEDPNTFTSWHVILKVSGIWETHTEFGLTYKFIITPKYKET
jgi:hypothetical protein